MPFTLDPLVAQSLAKLAEDDVLPKPPAGDVFTRRTHAKVIMADTLACEDVDVRDFYAKADDGYDILCRWYAKSGCPAPGSAVLSIHGGGMIAFSIDLFDIAYRKQVSLSGVPLLAVDYRLAPESKSLLTDVYAGLRLLHNKADELGVDPKRIAIMGESAGGGLAASLAHYAKQKGGPSICKQILIYPMLDDRTVDVEPELAPFLVWDVNDNKTGWGALLGDRAGYPNVSPIEAAGRMTIADARGLPPTYIDVGELDLFRDEDIEYARKLTKAGVSTELHLYPSVPHAFEALAPESTATKAASEARIKALTSI